MSLWACICMTQNGLECRVYKGSRERGGLSSVYAPQREVALGLKSEIFPISMRTSPFVFIISQILVDHFVTVNKE
jgi:hypothetical protein